MFRLEDLSLFVRAAAFSSFSDAAREAGIPPAQVSSAIKRLETALNIRLFARSTRSLRLTVEGETWLPFAEQMLDTLQSGLQKIHTSDDEVGGTLQIAVPSDLGRNLLLNVFREFRERHPALRLRIARGVACRTSFLATVVPRPCIHSSRLRKAPSSRSWRPAPVNRRCSLR